MMEHDYMVELIRQFKKARGLDKFDINDEGFQREFTDYIQEMYSHRNEYIRLLHTLNVYTDDERTVEVGKGPLDSAVIDTKSTIVTPVYNLFEEREGKTFEGTSIIHNGDICMKKIDGIEELDIASGRVYMTHNMYHFRNTEGWYQLTYGNDVLIGAYGRIIDNDKDKKIKKINERFNEIGNAFVNHGIVDDYYYYAMKSKPKTKELVKVKHRELEYGRVR